MSIKDMLDREFGTIPELIHAHAQVQPQQLALIEGDRSLDYASLDALMDRFAATLQREGLQAGDIIAICAASSIEYAVAFLGAIRIGVAVAPLAPSSTAEGLASMLSDCAAQWLFLDAATARTLEPVRASLRVTCVALDGDERIGVGWDKWLAPPEAHPKPVEVAPDGPFNVIYSSGTTGVPKGIVQPHRMRWAHVRRAESSGYGPNAVTLVSTPLYSNTTLVSFFPTVALGGAVVLMAKFDATKFLEASQRNHVTHAMLVPVQYQRIMDHPDFDRFDLSSYQMKFCTSAPFAAALKTRVLQKWPGGLVEYYGMTEGGGTCILLAHMFPEKLHTVGFPVPGHDIRLIDDDGKQVATGEAGEVVGASPNATMTGYHNQPSKTSDAEWYDETGKRFIRTGDIGRFDQDGFLTLIDRKKDMIISGGFNIYPSDLEAVLVQHPAIEEATVVGVPSERWGETPIAFAVRKPDHAAVSGDEVSAWFEHRVGKTQRLAAIEWVDALPRSPIGKVLKRELRDAYLKRTPT
ncbi:MAG TPA: class I adenylate-forming enzyme family protein [Polyangiales bacterium]|nr:class I adenylate-forming enzyme family protein [Polyangiales bacterium]